MIVPPRAAGEVREAQVTAAEVMARDGRRTAPIRRVGVALEVERQDAPMLAEAVAAGRAPTAPSWC